LETKKQHTLVVIVGATAIGKTNMAIQLAKHWDTEIISADSRQFFKEISIGTAKPSDEELATVPHHFIASHSIDDDINAGQFEVEALACLEKLFKRHNIVIAVGGSGLYIDALCKGLDDLPKASEEIRQEVITLYEQEGITYLQTEVSRLDPEYYTTVDIHNPQRLMRALEVCLATGKPFSSFRTQQHKERPFNIIKIGLNLPREELYNRINYRVDIMMTQGLLEEVKSMIPYRHHYALNTVGYTELFDYFDSKHDLKTALDLIKQNTRRFAKRQITWFGRDKDMPWFHPEETNSLIEYIEDLLK
jgi:tRNA dimethylallyltransferase